MTELEQFERKMKKELGVFEEKKNGTYRPPTKTHIDSIHRGLEVTLLVRMKKMSFLDEKFTTVVDTLSEFVAENEARKRALEEGWRHIAYTVSIKPKISELSQ